MGRLRGQLRSLFVARIQRREIDILKRLDYVSCLLYYTLYLATTEGWVIDDVPNQEGSKREYNCNTEGETDTSSELIDDNFALRRSKNARLMNQAGIFEDRSQEARVDDVARNVAKAFSEVPSVEVCHKENTQGSSAVL